MVWLFLVNSDNNVFSISQWPKSETYCLNNQENFCLLIIEQKNMKNSDEITKKKCLNSLGDKLILFQLYNVIFCLKKN